LGGEVKKNQDRRKDARQIIEISNPLKF
jgi:hypothetical protein